MKAVETFLPIPIDVKGRNKSIQHYDEILLSPLFSDSKFTKRVISIRNRFNIPDQGIKKYRVCRPDPKKKRWRNFISLDYGDKILKQLVPNVKNFYPKSQKAKIEKEITKLRIAFDLPIRFQGILSQYIKHNKYSSLYTHSSTCPMRVFNDKGKYRIFIEVFGDTKVEHVRDAWPLIRSRRNKYKIYKSLNSNRCLEKIITESNKTISAVWIEIFANTTRKDAERYVKRVIKNYNIEGSHLFRYKNYYPIKLGRISFDDYNKTNVYKWRFDKYIKNKK